MLYYLSLERLLKEDVFDQNLVEAKIREHLFGEANHLYRLWSLFMWELWRERWLEGYPNQTSLCSVIFFTVFPRDSISLYWHLRTGRVARERIRNHYSLEKVVRDYEAVYSDIVLNY